MFFAFYTKVHSHYLLSLRGFTATDSKMGPSISATILNFFVFCQQNIVVTS